MFTNILEYGASQFTPGVIKSLSNQKNIDQAYLNKVIAGSKGETKKEAPKLGINLKAKKSGTKTKGVKTSPAGKKETIEDDIANLKIEGYSDEEDEDTIKTAEHVTEGLDFYRRAS